MGNGNLAKALLQVQKNLDAAKKNSKNPHFKSKYANLTSIIEAVKEPLNEAGILILQPTGKDEHGTFVETQLVHAESGEAIKSRVYLADSAKADMQKLCGAITYARRYGIQTLVFLDAEDDDGNTAVGLEGKSKAQATESPAPAAPASGTQEFLELADVQARVEALLGKLRDADVAKAARKYVDENGTDLAKLQKFEKHLQLKLKEQKETV